MLSVLWCALALAALAPVTGLLRGSFPVFTVLWLLVPLVAVLRTRDAGRVGFRRLPLRELAIVTAANLGALGLVMVLCEPWSHTYRALLAEVLAAPRPDTTFAWLVRFSMLPAWGGLALYSGLVTLFAEELFFRGWLLQALQRRMSAAWAILLQALLFTLPNLMAALFLPPLQGVLYAVAYAWLGIGVIGGWAAWRTRSIWPSLISATICNLVLTALIV